MFAGRRGPALLALVFLYAGACSLGVPSKEEYFRADKNSCAGHCNSYDPAPGSSPECFCDVDCLDADDCCHDYVPVCNPDGSAGTGGARGDGGTGSCKGHCGSELPVPGDPECYCDSLCVEGGDCCPDYPQVCADAG